MADKKANSEYSRRANLNLSDETKSFQERIDEIRSLVEENLRYTKSIRQSTQEEGGLKSQKELQKLLQENFKISQELYEMMKKINRWINFQRIWGVLKILIIIIPLVLGVIYLPAVFRKGVEPIQKMYQEFLELGQATKKQDVLIQQFTNQLNNNEAQTQ